MKVKIGLRQTDLHRALCFIHRDIWILTLICIFSVIKQRPVDDRGQAVMEAIQAMAKIVTDCGQLKGDYKKRRPLRDVSIMVLAGMPRWLFHVQEKAIAQEAEERQRTATERAVQMTVSQGIAPADEGYRKAELNTEGYDPSEYRVSANARGQILQDNGPQ